MDVFGGSIVKNNSQLFLFLTTSKEYPVQKFFDFFPSHFFSTRFLLLRVNPFSSECPTKQVGLVAILTYAKYPNRGKVFLVKDQQVIPRENVTQHFQKTLFLRKQSMASRGWTLDIWQCIDRLDDSFSLNQVYAFADELQLKHPENNHVKDKVRQQLQVLRDKGIIEFVSRGHYRKLY